MQTSNEPGVSEPLLAHRTFKPVNFYCNAPDASRVEITGDFTGWSRLPMLRRVDGWWYLQFPLPHGHHLFRFMIDDEPALDPKADGKGNDDQGRPASIVTVS